MRNGSITSSPSADIPIIARDEYTVSEQHRD